MDSLAIVLEGSWDWEACLASLAFVQTPSPNSTTSLYGEVPSKGEQFRSSSKLLCLSRSTNINVGSLLSQAFGHMLSCIMPRAPATVLKVSFYRRWCQNPQEPWSLHALELQLKNMGGGRESSSNGPQEPHGTRSGLPPTRWVLEISQNFN